MDQLSRVDLGLLAVSVWLIYKLVVTVRRRLHTTRLNGPPASTWFFGVSREVFVGDSGTLYEGWMDKYGVVYQIPTAMGSRRTVLCDPKAIAHFYNKTTNVYVRSSFSKKLTENIVRNICFDSHYRCD